MARQIERYIPSSYDLFKKLPVSDICEHGFIENFYSRNDLKSKVLDFVVEGNMEHLIVPNNTYLKLSLALVPKDKYGNESDENRNGAFDIKKIGLVNNIFQSIIERVEIKISNENISKTHQHNPYRAYLMTICNFGKEAHDTYFRLSGWYKDTASFMDVAGPSNLGWEFRKGMLVGDNTKRRSIELIGKIMSPIFFQEKVLPTQVTMRVTLEMKNSAFYMMVPKDAGNIDYEFIVEEAILMVQKVNVVPGLKQAYIDLLEENHPIPYFLTTPYITHYAIDKNSTQFNKDNLFLGKVPTKIVFGMVLTDAFLGDKHKNPFNFQHFDVSEIRLYKDGQLFPRQPIKIDVENGITADGYHHFMTTLNAAYTRFTPSVSIHDYYYGYFLIPYNMSPDQQNITIHPSALFSTSSNIRLEMIFKNPLAENVTLLVYHETVHLMEINRNREASIDF